MIQFQLHTKTYAGIGAKLAVLDILTDNQYSDVTILVDEVVSKTTCYQQFEKQLSGTDKAFTMHALRSSAEPDYDYLDEVASNLRKNKVDCIIGIGGGSVLDITKAAAILLTNPGKGVAYRGFDKAHIPAVPTICIPTTAGTGSEITINAVFTSLNENKKLGINGRYLNATYAILDPEFTISAPEKVAVSSGVDALVHTLESFVGTKNNMITRMYAKEAFKLLYENLPCIVHDPDNLEKRFRVQLGAYYAATSLFNSSSGIAGGLSYPLGVFYKVPHGIGGGMFALPVVKYNVSHGYYDYASLYDVIAPEDYALTAEQKCEKFIACLDSLTTLLNVPTSFETFGISDECFSHIVEIMQPLQGAFDQNPVKLDVKNVDELLRPFFSKQAEKV
jgi:alcohol dehydrogenase